MRLTTAAFLVAVLLAAAVAAPSKDFRATDGAFTLRLDEDFKEIPNSEAVLSLVLPQNAFMVVCVKVGGTKLTPEGLLQEVPRSVQARVLGSAEGKCGGREAAFFVLEGLFSSSEKQLAALGLPADTTFRTVMAFVPGPATSYVLQAHYPAAAGKDARDLGLTMFNQAVVWH